LSVADNLGLAEGSHLTRMAVDDNLGLAEGSHLAHMAAGNNLGVVEEYIAVEVFHQLINNLVHMVVRLAHIGAVVAENSAIA